MGTKHYKHIFIDLDKTLWDFDSNARQTFREIYLNHKLEEKGVESLDKLFAVYTRHNNLLWGHYRNNEIKKEVLNIRRFEWTLNDFGIDDLILTSRIADDYITLSPKKTILFPAALEGLEYLHRKYALHMITNGFEEVQQQKLDNCKLRRFFTTITTSEEAGVKKPNHHIFDHALEKAGALHNESLMIGDDMKVDIEGARAVGIDQAYFNPEEIQHNGETTFEFSNWEEISKFL